MNTTMGRFREKGDRIRKGYYCFIYSKKIIVALHLTQDSITVQKEHYQLLLLLRHTEVNLPNSYLITKHRLTTLCRFLNDPYLKAEYIDVMNGYLEKGFAKNYQIKN